MIYDINEIFATIQGEARFTGTPSAFVRTQGCDVGCPWCDTKGTWVARPDDRVSTLFRGSSRSDPVWSRMTAADVAIRAREEAGPAIRHAVITGGEPLAQELSPMIEALTFAGFRSVQVETSGTYGLGKLADDPHLMAALWLTVSPKVGMPGGRKIDPGTLKRADEIKWPVGKALDVERCRDFLTYHFGNPDRVDIDVWLQPLSGQERATSICVDACKLYGFKLSLQTHLFAKIP